MNQCISTFFIYIYIYYSLVGALYRYVLCEKSNIPPSSVKGELKERVYLSAYYPYLSLFPLMKL
ncbi:unnamed protein product [Phytomonas sp. Hart1]|nr:unnamed protein product [Phytomonas sp. Hart1]|eukprot:CCW70104.1 unnamed protein product [Phytomonas sp. isolate Hart1]